jgi:hypothetical protein
MAKQKMIQSESQEMIAPDEVPATKHHPSQAKFKHKALVNMTLHGGTQLVQGEYLELSENEMMHLKTSFGEGLKHILE